MAVERAFGKLKGRFRTLLGVVPHRTSEKQAKIFTVCCAFHNVMLALNDNTNIARPTLINNDGILESIETIERVGTREIAQRKRDAISNLLDGRL